MQFFDDKVMQRIRFLHYKIKHLEEALEKEDENFSLDDLNLVLEYTKVLNVNYKMVNHKAILKELNITSFFHDPLEDKDIEIYDLMFECSRSLWVLARAYIVLSEKFEEIDNDWDSALLAMFEACKMYKTAAYFSAASIYQHDKGRILIPENLELSSEEARGWAQSTLCAKEEANNNLYFASKLYAGLSIMSRRLFYLKKHDEKKKQQIRAQFHFDMGKACQLKAQATVESSLTNINKDKVIKLKQKAIFYFIKAKEIWENMLGNLVELSKEEKENLELNLNVAEEEIKEINVETISYEYIKKIQDPEPIILIPENLAPFVPKSTIYLTKIVPKDLNLRRFQSFKGKKLEQKIPYSKREKLLDKRAGSVRTINELKMLYENKEVDLDKYAELMEKYSVKLKMIDTALEKLSKK